MTCGELRATVQDLVGSHNGIRAMSATMVDEFILKASYSVFKAIRNWRTRGEATSSIVAGTASYDLPAALHRIESVVLMDDSGEYQELSPIPHDSKHLDYENSGPAYYVTQGSTTALPAVVIVPTPASSIANGLKVRYRKRPTRLSSYSAVTDEYVDCDEDLHLALCHEAAFLYLERQGSKATKDFASYREYFQREVALAQAFHDEERQPDRIPTVRFETRALD